MTTAEQLYGMSEREAFDRLRNLPMAPQHTACHPSEMRSLYLVTADEREHWIYRTASTFYDWTGGRSVRLTGDKREYCFSPHTENDFRVRRRVAMILQQFGYAPLELATDPRKDTAYLFCNCVRVGARYAAYQYTGANKVGAVVKGLRAIAYGDTPEEAVELYNLNIVFARSVVRV